MRQVLGPGALGRPRGIWWRGRWEGGLGWGIHVAPWLIHVNVWPNPLQCCEVISLQLIKINEKKKKKEVGSLSHYFEPKKTLQLFWTTKYGVNEHLPVYETSSFYFLPLRTSSLRILKYHVGRLASWEYHAGTPKASDLVDSPSEVQPSSHSCQGIAMWANALEQSRAAHPLGKYHWQSGIAITLRITQLSPAWISAPQNCVI